MRILKSWLVDYLNSNVSDEDLVNKIIFSGTEVEDVIGEIDGNVIVVEIKQIDKHPNADRLHQVVVNDGKNDIQIVCGAPNIEVGQRVPLAKPGTKIGDMEISEAVIRGVASSGMLCSERELGVGDDHSGIKILPPDTPLGTKISEILSQDIVLDIKPTPNRGDCFSHIGMAREVAATLSETINYPNIKFDAKNKTKDQLNIEIFDKNKCPRYGARIIKNIKVGPSNNKIANRLLACGFKPINNIVDITNYIMLDLGQPMHAFDAKKIKDYQIAVRSASDNEEMISLDDKIRILSDDDLVIADFEKPIAIAGIIGGKNSEIESDTIDIILEAAQFNPKTIRKTAKKLEIMTDASYRFERGIDSAGIERALNKATQMILEYCPDAEVGECVIVGNEPERDEIEINFSGINDLLGHEFKDYEVNKVLENLGFEISGSKCAIPTFRHDIVDFRCLAEEVGRIYGYNKLPMHNLPETNLKPKRGDYFKREYIKDILANLGFSEVYNYSFMSEHDLRDLDISDKNLLVVKNPVQPENKYMRNSLIPGLLKSVAKNPTFDPVLMFEIGNVFTKTDETSMVGVVASGKDPKKLIESAKAALSRLGNIKNTIEIKELIGDDANKYKIKKQNTFVFEIKTADIIAGMSASNDDLDLKVSDREIHFRPVSKFPSVTRDLAFILDIDVKSDNIISEIYKLSNLINRVELFDEFASDMFGLNKKNVAFHIYLQAPDKTLNDHEADQIIQNIISEVEDKYNAKLRG
ncbi:MAG: phenylalanine--tRNA ligase subunit beta [Patescibacteria group bacterium]|jgi:phenylalanyl-tRNA synthetase beta chain